MKTNTEDIREQLQLAKELLAEAGDDFKTSLNFTNAAIATLPAAPESTPEPEVAQCQDSETQTAESGELNSTDL